MSSADDTEPVPSLQHALELAAEALEAQAAAFRALARAAAESEHAAKENAIRVQDLAARWGVGLSTVYDLVRKQHLRAFRVGTAVCVPLKEVASYEKRRQQP